jgi:2-dehydro-3-deoxyphosphogalactonate aldolase
VWCIVRSISFFKAGARYIISPDTNPDVIRKTKELDCVSIPGFMTPTEGFSAIRAGADYLKCFPCGKLGVGHIKDLKAVIKKPILAVGGVSAANLPEFLGVADGAGIGSELYKPGKPVDEIMGAAKAFAAAFAKSSLAGSVPKRGA